MINAIAMKRSEIRALRERVKHARMVEEILGDQDRMRAINECEEELNEVERQLDELEANLFMRS